ncbi:ribonuclease Z [Thalassobaculum fulvum]|uniref:Ribonuclease Z n=1 Tax=Thalassobaculum fulvum TaxID=1633335 RepID=A0A919CMU7_9PROT|nr:MBL fold metallo-hydrolase [Thalassobaculum fulvum]GHD42387.1 ribonuclease Z [Thalassobaculum fulvum]
MKVTLLGTGCPQCHTKRYGPASLVRHGEVSVLIDCGSGVTQRLVGAGCPGGRLDAVLLTHLHSDHLVDLYQLIVSGWHQNRTVPQRIYGPKGTRAYVEGLLALWREERELRMAHERRPNLAGFTAEVVEYGEGPVVELPGLFVDAVKVEHEPIKEAYGFVFRADDGTVAAFSGDTRYCEALIEAARGADVLVHECFIHGLMKPVPGVRTQEGIDAVASYHTLSAEVGKVASEAGVGFLMLNHFVPAEFDREALAAEVAQDFAGPFAIGEDLMSYDVPTRTLTHGDAHWRLGS